MTLPPTTACLQKRLQKAVHQEDVCLEGGQQVPGYFLLIVLEQKVNPLGSLEYVQAGFWTTDEPHQWGQGSDASQQLCFCAVESSLAAPEMAEVDQRQAEVSLSSHKTFSAGNRDFPPTYQNHRPSPWGGLFHVTITQITKIIR